MPIVIPRLGEEVSRERIRLLKTSIKELDRDIETYCRISSTVQRRRDSLLKSVELERAGRCSFLCVILPFGSLKRSKFIRKLLSSDQELEDVEKKLRRLRGERGELEHILHMYEATFAPISRLPPEILEAIFIHALPSTCRTPSRIQAPINLTMVCHNWRALALATPVLWASMSTSSDWPLRTFSPVQVKPDDPQLYDILTNQSLSMGRSNQPNAWIHRARNLPFRMEIVIPPNDLWFGPHDPYKTWVLQTSSQWSHLRIQSNAAGMAALLAGPLHKMQTLELVGRIADCATYTCYADFDLKTENFRFPWNSLTTLDASSTWILLRQLLSIISQAPSLRVCRAKVLLTHSSPLWIRPRTTHCTLTTLEIKFRCEHSFRAIIDYFTLPSLTSLHCSNPNPYVQFRWPESDIIAFAKRSQCPLETFHARGFWMDEEAAISAARAVLPVFPGLRDVNFAIQ